MHDGMFVFDNVVHMYDNSAVNVINTEMANKRFTESLYSISAALSGGERFKSWSLPEKKVLWWDLF
jgi:hypothetical protein